MDQSIANTCTRWTCLLIPLCSRWTSLLSQTCGPVVWFKSVHWARLLSQTSSKSASFWNQTCTRQTSLESDLFMVSQSPKADLYTGGQYPKLLGLLVFLNQTCTNYTVFSFLKTRLYTASQPPVPHGGPVSGNRRSPDSNVSGFPPNVLAQVQVKGTEGKVWAGEGGGGHWDSDPTVFLLSLYCPIICLSVNLSYVCLTPHPIKMASTYL
jgi:hypothetical protein